MANGEISSDTEIKSDFQINDRASFQRFFEIEAFYKFQLKTIWLVRERLIKESLDKII